MTFKIEEREDGLFNLWEITEFNKILRIGGARERPEANMPIFKEEPISL